MVKKKSHKIHRVLHNLYFSKPYKEPVKKKGTISKLWTTKAKPKPPVKTITKRPAKTITKPEPKKPGLFSLFKKKPQPEPAKAQVFIPAVAKPQFVPLQDKNLEKRLEQMQTYIEKRLDANQTSLMILKDLIDELKRENEALRKDKRELIDKINTQSYDPNLPNWEEPETDEKTSMGSFAEKGSSNVKTSMDQLLDMINDKGSVKISDAAKKLKIKDKQIEEWAKVLEEHGLIEVHYPAIGKPVLKKKG